MAHLGIVDVEIGGPFAGPNRCVISHEGTTAVLYLRAVTLTKVAEEAADALFLRGTYGLAVDGVWLDGRHILDGDLVAELGVRR